MKVLLVCVHFHSSFGWSIERALSRLGHEVRVFDYRNPSLEVPGRVKLLWARTVMPRELLAVARKFRPDLVFLAKAETVPAETVVTLRKELACPVVNWFPDARLFAYANVFEQAPHLDWLFSKNPSDVSRTKFFDLKNVRFLAHCADREIHVEPEMPEKELSPFRCEVAFVGSRYKYRDEMLCQVADYDLRVWGGGWERSRLAKMNPKTIAGGEARSLVQTRVFRAASVNLNTHHFDDYDSLNQRVFDIAGAGGCQIVDGYRDVGPIFQAPEDLQVYLSAEDLREKLRFLIDHPDLSREMGARSQGIVAAAHTYDHRVREILDLLGFA